MRLVRSAARQEGLDRCSRRLRCVPAELVLEDRGLTPAIQSLDVHELTWCYVDKDVAELCVLRRAGEACWESCDVDRCKVGCEISRRQELDSRCRDEPDRHGDGAR